MLPSATDDAVVWLCSGMTIVAKTVEVVGKLSSGMSVACDRCQQKVIGQWLPIRIVHELNVGFKGPLDKAHKGLVVTGLYLSK